MSEWTRSRFGLVDSLARPGANLTGLTNFSFEIGPKRLELLSELLGPDAASRSS